MATRISKEVKQIADAHIQAKLKNAFDNPEVSTREQVFEALNQGKTFSELLHQIEIRFCSITSLLVTSQLNHMPESYKRQVYKGFKVLFENQSK